MNKHERVGIVLLLTGFISIISPTITPSDPTAFEIYQQMIGSIILIAGAARFIWSDRNDE